MTAKEIERFRRVEVMFDGALECPPGPEREAYLNREAAGDDGLLAEVRQLLADDEQVNTAVPAPPEALPTFGVWQAVKLLGRGGMGMVYLAERADGAFKMQAAVKVVPLALASPDIEERFRRERQFLASLDHPKIARLIDGGITSSGLPYLVMDYVDGLPIDRYSETHNLDTRARITLMRQVLEALIYVHGQQVIHRDLKSSNILVDAAGNTRLLDFGTARLVDSGGDTAITRTGVFAFTPECASPEQVLGKPLTFASDIYSAGVLLYRLLTGRAPYQLKDDPGAMADIVTHQEPDASGLDSALDAILSKALRKNPEERYRSAEEMDADLARYLAGRPVRARRPRKVGLLALAVASVSVCGAAGWIASGKPGGVSFLPWGRGEYVISTVAGAGQTRFAGSGAPAMYADLISPQYLAADSAGNVFVTDPFYSHVFRISSSGFITVYAGTGEGGFSGDNGPATAAKINGPLGLAVDAAGNLFIMDNGNARIRKVTPDGAITTVATVMGGCMAADAAGNLYVSQTLAQIIHKVSPDGVVSTFAGTGKAGFAGDGGKATEAELYDPAGLRTDAAGNLYVADAGNNRIRKITPDGIISTFAGNGNAAFAGDGRLATEASLQDVADVAVGADGSVYIADSGNSRIRVVSPGGIISTFAGGIPEGPAGTMLGDGPAVQAALQAPVAIAVEYTGTVVVAVRGDRQVRRITPPTITTIAGVLPRAEASDSMPAIAARLLSPDGLAIDRSGEIYLSDAKDERIRKINTAGIITTIAGNGLPGQSPDDGPPKLAGGIGTLALDPAGNLYFTTENMIREIMSDGTLRTVAGGTQGFSGDDGPAILARLSGPGGMAADAQGNLYIADSGNNRVRRVDAASRKIVTIAGTGRAAYGGDHGPATAAALSHPSQLAFDKHGNLYISDTGNNRIRKISPDGMIATFAGNGAFGETGDGGDASVARLIQPSAIAVDAADNVFTAPKFGVKIRKVDGATHRITTIAGTGVPGFSGDGGFAQSAMINSVRTMAVDGSGNIYFADGRNRRVRKLTPTQASRQ